MILDILKRKSKNKLLLHICCAGCGAYVSQVLKADHDVSLFFYNPNIFPANECEARAAEAEKIAKKFGLKIIIGENDHKKWLKKVRGYENEPERGERCVICYEDRLKETAKKAKVEDFQFFATTLSVSPHKNAELLNLIGEDLAKKYGIKFVPSDFKKKDGFKKASLLSKELDLYRQNYCGCEFSIRKAD
jgi:predicted adenine nucleotide alpha hydrolase (AANH) superfamily ATPase